MSEFERLTKRITEGVQVYGVVYEPNLPYATGADKMAGRLAQYEDIGSLEEFASLRKHPEGIWERIENPYGELEAFTCGCGYFGLAAYPYCPHCGREMSGGEAKLEEHHDRQ